jgi:hypothetical protein
MSINGVAVSRLLYPVQWMRGNDGIYPVQAGDVVTLALSAAIPNPSTTALEVYFYPAK